MVSRQNAILTPLLTVAIVFLLTLAFAGRGALAQTPNGSLSGDVTDASGALVPGATVHLKNENTGVENQFTSTSAGHYVFSNLIPGSYQVTVSQSAFKTEVRTGVVVSLGSTTALNISLAPGSTYETVTVKADALKIDTESSEVGTVVTPEEVTALPLSVGTGGMRNAVDFIFLAPATYGIGTAGGDYYYTFGGGQQFGSQNIIDGIPFQAPDNGDGIAGGPSIDALQEFKSILTALPAEYGNTTGGVQSYVTKSGTNTIHGTVYDIFRNTVLDANNWFSNGYAALNPQSATIYKRPADDKDEYGFTVGGPVRIPKVYNGRNRTFFFFSWEQFHQHLGNSLTETVPTTAMRGGDFSATLTNTVLDTNPCNGQPIYQGQIFDPSTTQTVSGLECRDPFPLNKISNISTVANNILSHYYPTPTNSNQTLNYAFAANWPITDTGYTIRVDQQFSSADSVWASYTWRKHSSIFATAPSMPEPEDPTGVGQMLEFDFLRFGYTHTFSPSVFNAFRLGWTHEVNLNTPPSYNSGENWDALLGIQGLGAAGPLTFPNFTFGESLSPLGTTYGVYIAHTDIYTATDSLGFIRGKHTITVGGEGTLTKQSINTNGAVSGDFSFGREQTAATQATALNSGNGFASFLLGEMGLAQDYNELIIPRGVTDYGAVYIQDAYKASKTLFFSLGLRWDVYVPSRDANNNDSSNFDATVPNPGAGGILGSMIFSGTGPGRSGVSSRFADTWYKDVAPRFGFTWSPEALQQKTVFRGFYGIQYAPLLGFPIGNYPGAGFTATSYLEDWADGGFGAPYNLDSPYPAFPQTLDLDPTLNNGGTANYIGRNEGRPGLVQAWTAEVQQQLATDMIFTLGYLGQHGTRLRSGDVKDMDALTPQYYAMGNTLNETVDGINAPFPYPGFQGSIAQSLRPFPQYTYISDYLMGDYGVSFYDALYAKLERRFRNGLSLLASYTWSKALNIGADSIVPGNAEALGYIQDPFNIKQEKALAQNDTPQMLVLSFVYQLPAGKNKRFLNRGGLENVLLAGWQLSGIQRYMSGQPSSQFGGCATSIPGTEGCIRYNHVAGQSLFSDAWRSGKFNPFTQVKFNPAAFSDPNGNIASGGGYTFGDLPRVEGAARSGTFLNEDMSLEKLITVYKSLKIEFRFEAFNIFNRHVFGLGDSNVTSPTFGQVTGLTDSPRQAQATLRIHF
jgi:hypothetical protein